MIMIAMEMVIAMLVNANAYMIMNMHKTAHIMDVSKSFQPLFLILLSNEGTILYISLKILEW